jgi:DNA segregation ATPase FtsK/SpoIIIE, S-DNA-T family
VGRYAVLVATWEYVDPELQGLRAPAQDARQLARLLENPDVGYFEDVQVLLNEPKWIIEESIEELFRARTPDDTVLLYLSCHGVKDEEGRLFFAAIRSRPRRPDSTAISARFVNELMSRSRASGKIVLVDCCYSGAFARGFDARSTTGGELTQQVQGRGSYVMSASDELEYAYEDDRVRRLGGPERPSVFTGAVIEGLRTGIADADRDGVITVSELFRYVENHVREAQAPQTPRLFGAGVHGEIVVAKASRPHPGLGDSSDEPFTQTKLPLDVLLPPLGLSQTRGLCALEWEGNGRFVVPLGRVYEPGRGWRHTMRADLSGGAGHLAVCGGPLSGKTTALCTLICSLALTHSPQELQVYCLRDGIEGLAQLAPLPHVGAVADYASPADVAQIIEGAIGVLNRREKLYEKLGIRSLRAFRTRRVRSDQPDDQHGEIFIVIDSWLRFERRFPELAQQTLRIARIGLRYGIHLVVAVSQWQELSDELRLHFGTWIELALSDPRESSIDVERAAAIPRSGSGFGLVRDRTYIHVGVPELSEHPSVHDDWDGLDELVTRIKNAWTGPPAPPIERPQFQAPPSVELPDLLGLGDPATYDITAAWATRPAGDRLRIPIGVGEDGTPVELDLKESAQGGMGPHGMCIGATGSGKSELLRTLILGLAMTHSPEVLNFVLVDFKGGAAFLGFDSLQHVSAVITNLADDLPLVDRMYDALHGEMVRRQELLRATGNYASLHDYERAREKGADLNPIPTLFIVLDEFSELLSAKPEFIELFVMIGRLGRSLGVHILLASQRLEEGRLRGLDAQLSYRIGLRAFSAMESRAVLGVPDAYELPPIPGMGYLKKDPTSIVSFRSAYVSGPHRKAQDSDGVYQSVAEVVLERLAGKGPTAHGIWLPPLDEPPCVNQLLPPLHRTQTQGLTTAGWDLRGKLRVPVGVVDRPLDQRRDPLWLDLDGAAGHVGVAGAPQSGKSTMLRTLISSLALTHTPQEVQFYCLDFGGGTLTAFSGLPHVGGVASRLDTERVRRTVAEVTSLLEQREREFAAQGIDSVATYRRLRAEGRIADDGFGDVFLIVDGWLTLRQEFEAVEPAITDVAARGLGFGIHVVAAANRWSEFRAAVRDLFGTKLELRLGDPYESEVNRKLAANVPEQTPGRGLTRDGHHFLTALPRIDGRETADSLSNGVSHLLAAVQDAWSGPTAPKVRLLPNVFPVSELPAPTASNQRISIGVDESALAPAYLDFMSDPHFMVFGEPECGKSNLLRLIAEAIIARHPPAGARLVFVDYRRSLLDTADTEHRIAYAPSSTAAQSMMSDIVRALNERLPPLDVTPDQLRARSWWTGPDLYLVVDDYDLVSISANPLAPIAELLPQARDIGLHLILARSIGGAARAMYDPVIQRMREMATPALVMSGDEDEGALFGSIRPQRLPRGRGFLIQRHTGAKLVQTALVDPGSGSPRPDSGEPASEAAESYNDSTGLRS